MEGYMRAVVWSFAVILGACDASFTDLRTPEAEDSGAVVLPDGGTTSDPDSGALEMATELAGGRFIGRAGHGGGGTASLMRLEDGNLELRFSEDFFVSGAP